MWITNPLTGRKIKKGGKTHKKLLDMLEYIVDETCPRSKGQRGGATPSAPAPVGEVATETKQLDDDFYKKLAKKSQSLDKIKPYKKGATDTVNVPKSKYDVISSALPPNPVQHSWYHHHTPFSQNFGDYVCLKKSTLQELGLFLKDSLLSDVK